MNIGIDVDEVLADLVEAFLEYHNHNYGTNYAKKDMFSYSFHEVLGETEEEFKQKVLDFFTTDFFNNTRLVAGAKEGIASLAKKHQLYVITARPQLIRPQTEKLIAENFPNYFSTVTLTNEWHGAGKMIRKSEVCTEKNISIMVDDSLIHAHDCASKGVYVLLADFGYPWNRAGQLPKNIKRVHSWKEIVEEVAEYEKRKSGR